MKILLSVVGMISFTVIANLLLKTGVTVVDPVAGPIQQFLNWRVFLGLCSFGVSVCFYMVVLQWLPLNVAQSFTAAQFVAIIFASAWILSEPIRPSQWLGITFIAMGIAMVGWSRA